MEKTRTIKIWTVTGEQMREFGYSHPNLFFAPIDRSLLSDLDECHCYEVDLPARYHVGANAAHETVLWDGDGFACCSVDREETCLHVTRDAQGHSDTYPLRGIPVEGQ